MTIRASLNCWAGLDGAYVWDVLSEAGRNIEYVLDLQVDLRSRGALRLPCYAAQVSCSRLIS